MVGLELGKPEYALKMMVCLIFFLKKKLGRLFPILINLPFVHFIIRIKFITCGPNIHLPHSRNKQPLHHHHYHLLLIYSFVPSSHSLVSLSPNRLYKPPNSYNKFLFLRFFPVGSITFTYLWDSNISLWSDPSSSLCSVFSPDNHDQSAFFV